MYNEDCKCKHCRTIRKKAKKLLKNYLAFKKRLKVLYLNCDAFSYLEYETIYLKAYSYYMEEVKRLKAK